MNQTQISLTEKTFLNYFLTQEIRTSNYFKLILKP